MRCTIVPSQCVSANPCGTLPPRYSGPLQRCEPVFLFKHAQFSIFLCSLPQPWRNTRRGTLDCARGNEAQCHFCACCSKHGGYYLRELLLNPAAAVPPIVAVAPQPMVPSINTAAASLAMTPFVYPAIWSQFPAWAQPAGRCETSAWA